MIKKKNENVESCKCTEECHCKGGCCCCKALMALVSIATLVFAILACVYAYKSLNFNILSMGGKENFKKMETLYKSEAYISNTTDSINQSIESFNAQYGNTTSDSNVENADTNVEGAEGACPTVSLPTFDAITPSTEYGFEVAGTLSAEEISKLKENGVIYGPENAKLTILEFADASCGYCKRQIGQDFTVDAILNQYDNVNMMFKNMPIFNETAAEAMACSENYLAPEDYHHFVISVFQMDDSTNVDALANLASCFGADASTIAACVNNGDTAEEVSTTMSEGSNFGISGTPSSVIINNESGEYIVVPGAYPADAFAGAIETLLA